MIDRIAKALSADPRFSAWQVQESRARSRQRYQVFRDVEALREVETRAADVRVHVEHDHDGKPALGESSFTVVAGADDAASLARELDLAYARARLVHNRPWTLPTPERAGAAPVQTTDPSVVEDPAGAAERVAAAVTNAARKSRGVELSACEVFCDYRRVHLVNSRGLDLVREDTSLYTEYVLLAKGAAQDEIEVYQSRRARRVEDLHLEEAIADDVEATQASLRAVLPATQIVDVVVGGQGVEELFDAFVAHAAGPAAFEGWTRFKPGAPILEDAQGDALTIVSDATIEGALGTFAFDDVGLPGGRHVVVEDGVFKARVNEQRYACWLGEPATGAWGNTVVSSGTTPEKDLLVPSSRPLYHLLRFSQLSPHAYSGAFSGEIRLGYRVEPDGTRTPIRGGSVSGVVFDAFRRARLSSERAVRGRTHAPRAVRLDGVQITGA